MIGVDGREDGLLAGAIGSRQAGDEPPGPRQVRLGDHGRIGYIDEGLFGDAVLAHVASDLAQHRLIDRLVRGVAVFVLADDRDAALDTQQREDELLEIRALIFAVAVGDVGRQLERGAIGKDDDLDDALAQFLGTRSTPQEMPNIESHLLTLFRHTMLAGGKHEIADDVGEVVGKVLGAIST